MENFKNYCFLENNIDSFDTIYYDFICLLIYNEKYRSIHFEAGTVYCNRVPVMPLKDTEKKGKTHNSGTKVEC